MELALDLMATAIMVGSAFWLGRVYEIGKRESDARIPVRTVAED